MTSPTMPAYEPVSQFELDHVRGPQPGALTIRGVILWGMHSKGVRDGGIYNRRSTNGSPLTIKNASLHAAGRGVDIMVPSREVGDELLFRLMAAAPYIGVTEVIWNRKRYTAAHPEGAPFGGVSPHTDHVHIGIGREWALAATPGGDYTKWADHFLAGSGGW